MISKINRKWLNALLESNFRTISCVIKKTERENKIKGQPNESQLSLIPNLN